MISQQALRVRDGGSAFAVLVVLSWPSVYNREL